MKKTTDRKTDSKEKLWQKNTVLAPANQEEVPFLYIAMREPTPDYKEAGRNKKKLYRIVKVK